ncbi:hypothetical protein BGZ61DRAFT_482245 [Ilyonectria robusta]|uniref:uncharacterized protein n=1 Tax=Ilyonectria robusta TaxID=1079257 RepID=UPI001E8DB074|nr:uncharacterized protein BGZ61DRAFT_482245 [Ilyonectria robusta]KAH8672975.1 hypothetical protein BGZ61DRAFT_482245 [Ilyonectria robusta]
MIASFGIQANSTSSPAASPTHHVSLRPHGFFAPSVMTWPSPRGTQAPKNQSVHPHKARHRQGASATRCAYFLHADGAEAPFISAMTAVPRYRSVRSRRLYAQGCPPKQTTRPPPDSPPDLRPQRQEISTRCASVHDTDAGRHPIVVANPDTGPPAHRSALVP